MLHLYFLSNNFFFISLLSYFPSFLYFPSPFICSLWTCLLNLFPFCPRLVDILSKEEILNSALISGSRGMFAVYSPVLLPTHLVTRVM